MMRYNLNPSERRTTRRFALQREVRFRLLERRWSNRGGAGRTIDISSVGVAFTTDFSLPHYATVELSISWPALLENDCPLQLVVRGHVVRNGAGLAACTIDKFEFKTQSRAETTMSILEDFFTAQGFAIAPTT